MLMITSNMLYGTPKGRRHNSGEKTGWVNCILFSLRKKKYSCSVAKLKLSYWCHVDCFIDVFTTFLDLGTFQLRCCLRRVREFSDFIRNILMCFPKMNEGLYGFGTTAWGQVFNDRIFILGWTIPLRSDYFSSLLEETTSIYSIQWLN